MAAVTAVVAGVATVATGAIRAIGAAGDKRDAKNKQRAAERGLNEAQDRLKAIDTSNPFEDAKNAYEGLDNKLADLDNVYDEQQNVYAGMENKFRGQRNAMEDMENAFEDLTVNTQQAEFEAQQMAQQQANIMANMAGAAGGSGIAALAQSMANAGALQAQKAAASIGAQEAQNQKLAAQADQSIQEKIATEQSRLDTTERSADMEIQKTQMGAEEAMQAARLGEASKLQLVEAQEEANLQMQEAQGAMEVQKLKGEGDMWSAQTELQKESTLMQSKMKEMEIAAGAAQAADESMWGGIGTAVGGLGQLSDERLKENIVKIKYSNSGIPIYKFNYKGDSKTWSGTMAQDLIKLGREDAVIMDDGYYRVDYNLIDIDMKEVKSSPFKQLGENPQEEMIKQKAMTDAGLDIIGGATKRKNWEDLQLDIKSIEPESMKLRKLKDQLLRDKEKKSYESGAQISLPAAYSELGFELVKRYKKELHTALENDDRQAEKNVQAKVANLASNVDVVKSAILEFYEDHFESESLLSKGVSQQQVSFATQMYCKNPELVVVYATQEDIQAGFTDYYGELVQEDNQYCLVYDFYNNPVMVNVLDGNKDMFIRDNLKALEYITFLNETHDIAVEANAGKSAVKIDLGRIDYKINSLFGFNDGTATKEQDELVMMFCHDSEVLRDGSTFRRHLYEHPNIQNLNYGGFDWDMLEFKRPLGPGDKGHWADEISQTDRLMLVDAIVNSDSPFFNMNLLRTLVKEYYTYKIENAWWKGMGFPEGKIEVMRLKIKELNKDRFKKEKAEAARNGQKNFTFDGKVYPTGMTDAKIKKQEKERAQALNKTNPEIGK